MTTSHLETKAPLGIHCSNSILSPQGRIQENKNFGYGMGWDRWLVWEKQQAFLSWKKSARFCLKQNCWQRNFRSNNASKAESGLWQLVDILPIYICRLVRMLVLARNNHWAFVFWLEPWRQIKGCEPWTKWTLTKHGMSWSQLENPIKQDSRKHKIRS